MVAMLPSSELLAHGKVELPVERNALEYGVLVEAIVDETAVAVGDLMELYPSFLSDSILNSS